MLKAPEQTVLWCVVTALLETYMATLMSCRQSQSSRSYSRSMQSMLSMSAMCASILSCSGQILISTRW